MGKILGTAIKRREDPALITGRGKYTDDFKLDNMVHCAMVRSPYANAKITGIDASEPHSPPRASSLSSPRRTPTAPACRASSPPAGSFRGWSRRSTTCSRGDQVRYVGDAVAVVVATDRYIARDAVDKVDVSYEALPAVHDPKKAVSGRRRRRGARRGSEQRRLRLGARRRREGRRSVPRTPPTSPRSTRATSRTGSSLTRSSLARRSPTTTRQRVI